MAVPSITAGTETLAGAETMGAEVGAGLTAAVGLTVGSASCWATDVTMAVVAGVGDSRVLIRNGTSPIAAAMMVAAAPMSAITTFLSTPPGLPWLDCESA